MYPIYSNLSLLSQTHTYSVTLGPYVGSDRRIGTLVRVIALNAAVVSDSSLTFL